MERTHIIETSAGKITIKESDRHVMITTEPLNVQNISAMINTVWRDCDTAVCVNGVWMDEAYAAGQWQHHSGNEQADLEAIQSPDSRPVKEES